MGLLACATAVGMLATHAAGETPALALEPCTIELVDGREVEGQLAVQFNMPDHLIVYSPRLATVRSFLKDHVHAVTVNGRREQLSPKRALTKADEELLGRVEWPDEPPAKGRKPPYANETWEAPRQLLVWARPGSAGRFSSAENWLLNGTTPKTLAKTEIWSGPSWHRGRRATDLDKDTDILMPAAAKSYRVSDRGSYLARHISVEAGASLHRNINSAYGNVWVAQEGRLDGGGCATLRGTKHTFFINGNPHNGGEPRTPGAFRRLMKSAKHFARKWIVRKDDPAASISMIGTIRSGDETHWLRGVTILEEDCVISIGGRCTQTVGRDAKLIMKSGSVLGKNGNQLYKDDMRLKGAFLVGTPEEPITRNCYLGLSIKDPEGTYPKSDRRPGRSGFRLKGTGASTHGQGLLVAPGATMRVHTADPGKAKLVVTWHGITDVGSDDGTAPGYFSEIPASERTVNMVMLDDLQLSDVTLDWFGKRDILMPNPERRREWKRVDYGGHNRAGADDLFGKLSLGEEATKELARYREEASKGGESSGFFAGTTLYTRNPGTPTIDTPDGPYPKGKTVTVRLSNETKGLEIRYTLDGADPSPSSRLYEEPFAVTEDTVVKAGGFKGGRQLGDTAEARFEFVDPRGVPMQEAADPGDVSPGLAYRYYEGVGSELANVVTRRPLRSGVVADLDPDAIKVREDGSALVFEGFIDIPAQGVYVLYLSTARKDTCHVHIGGQRVIANGEDELESSGLVGLNAGKHRLKVVFIDLGWGERIRLALREIAESNKRPVTPDMLSH
jgi:hypothetical protein